MAIVVSVICVSLATLTMLSRVYVRLVVVEKVGIPDYLGFVAFTCYIGILAAFYLQLHYGGFFVHQYDIRFQDFQKTIMASVILTFVYSVNMIFAKAAILLEWIQIFVPGSTRNAFYWGSMVMMTLNTLLYLVGIVLGALSCIPLSTLWEPWLQGKCLQDQKIVDAAAICFNLIIDVFILLLPQRIIWKLQMTRGRKIGISVVFSLGLLTITCAAGRVWEDIKLKYSVESNDTNYMVGTIYLWTLAESTCVIMVFAAPSTPKAFANSNLGSRIATYFRSNGPTGGLGSLLTWGGSGRNRDAVPRSLYGVMGDDGSQPGDDNQSSSSSSSSSQIELTQTMEHGGAAKAPRAGVGTATSTSSYSRGGPILQGGVIVRKTEFEAREDAASNNSSGQGVISRHHPWV